MVPLSRVSYPRAAVQAAFALLLAILFLSFGGASTAPGAFDGPDTPLVERVDRERLRRTVAKLSGGDTIRFDGETLAVNTRYARAPLMPRVREYLVREIRAAGYEPELQPFVLEIQVPDLTGAAVSAGRDTVWAVDAEGRVYRSAAADGWRGFERIASMRESAFDLERDPLDRLWVCCRLAGSAGGGLYRSSDGGVTWSLKASGPQIYTLGTISFGDALFGIAGGSGGTVLYTANGGEDWMQLDAASFDYSGIAGSAAAGPLRYFLSSDAGYLYEVTLGGGVTKRSLMFGRLGGIDFWGERAGVVVGSRKAFYTRDAGATWQPADVPAELIAVRMLDSLRVIAGAGAGEIWISENGGASWERFGAECGVDADVWAVAAAGRDTCWLAGRDVVRRITASGERACASWSFADTIWSRNIVFRREGATRPSRRVVLGAHYDSYAGVSSSYECAPGADDNASGTAAVIECARLLRDARLERTVEFVLFDAEELGLKGSRHFASVLDPSARYDGMLNLDMIGYEPNAAMTAVISGRSGDAGDSAIAAALGAAIDSFALDLDAAYLEGERLSSDHMAFWEVGVPAVLLIEGTRAELTPQYHTCFDGPTLLNYDFLEVCTQAALGAIVSLAGALSDGPPPAAALLLQNYPNPFNAGTIVVYTLPAAAPVELSVYDAAGRRVAVIDRGWRGAGERHAARWDGRNANGALVQSGVYFLRLRAGASESVRTMVVLR